MLGSSSTTSIDLGSWCSVAAPRVMPEARPITSTSSGASTNKNGRWATITWVGMSTVVEASTLPLLASQMFPEPLDWATVTTLERPSS
jgi:hypothetical protein